MDQLLEIDTKVEEIKSEVPEEPSVNSGEILQEVKPEDKDPAAEARVEETKPSKVCNLHSSVSRCSCSLTEEEIDIYNYLVDNGRFSIS